MNMKRTGILAATLAAALAAGCGTMGNMMGSGEQITLSGANEVPPVGSGAMGSGTVHVKADCTVTARVTVKGMTATAAHIHEGKAGANGGVLVPLTKSGDNTFVAPDGAKMTDAQCSAYKAGNTYVNVHSEAYKGGEVRAQLKGS
jgi:hypothetical protein